MLAVFGDKLDALMGRADTGICPYEIFFDVFVGVLDIFLGAEMGFCPYGSRPSEFSFWI